MTRFPEREAPLRLALAGIELTAAEERLIQWLARWDIELIQTAASLIARVRGVQP